jgi:hypothetical protein
MDRIVRMIIVDMKLLPCPSELVKRLRIMAAMYAPGTSTA